MFPSIFQAMRVGDVLCMQADDPFLSSLEIDQYREYGIHSALFVPLLSHGSVVGFLEIWESRQRRVFSQNEINLARAMASYAANIIQISNLFTDLKNSYDATLEGWARALELRDKDTEGHTRRVTELAVELARAMNLPREQIVHFQRGAILHDIGKIALPDSILQKPGALTVEETTIMRQHPALAYEMLSPIKYLRPALDIPYCHHERWDGKGYPRNLKGEQIPISARIFSVADVYDALTSDRPYRKAWDKSKAIKYIERRSGIEFDPQVVDVFLRVIKVMGEKHSAIK
jgi:HD-GYP domain-containing protein (c-di-GMP phosphodiesterase class II)